MCSEYRKGTSQIKEKQTIINSYESILFAKKEIKLILGN